jgi:uncharacterized protein YndB with AHSA1/START domain
MGLSLLQMVRRDTSSVHNIVILSQNPIRRLTGSEHAFCINQRTYFMGLLSFAPQPVSTRQIRNVSGPSPVDSSLAISMRVNADRQRLFQALTLPEYVEAWIAPSGEGNQRRAVSITPEGFRIEIPDSRSPDSSIRGSYLTRRRSKLIFTWQKGWAPDAPTSTVTIRLNGDFDRTEIVLNHAGLGCRREYEWHRTFWHESIRRLSGLFLSSK